MKRTAIEAFNETMLIFEKQCREQERFGEEFERNNQSDGVDKDLERQVDGDVGQCSLTCVLKSCTLKFYPFALSLKLSDKLREAEMSSQ